MYGHQVFPLMEGVVSTISNTPQRASLWVDVMKKIMLSETLKDKDDWGFIAVTDVDEAAAAGQIEATTSRIYGLLVAMSSAVGACWLQLTDDAGGGFTYDATAALSTAATCRALEYIPAAATSGTEEFWGFVYPMGIAITTDALLSIDGIDGTNLASDNLCRAWVVYRTINTE